MRIIPGYISNQKNGQTWTKKGDLPYFMKLANEHHHYEVARNVHVTTRCLYVVLQSKQRTLRSQARYLTLCALFSPIYKMGIIIKTPNSYVDMETKYVKYMQNIWNSINKQQLLSLVFGSQGLGQQNFIKKSKQYFQAE